MRYKKKVIIFAAQEMFMTKIMQSHSTLSLFKFGLYKLTGLTLVLGFLLRILLLFNAQTTIDFSFIDWLEIFLVGPCNDLFAAIIGYAFCWFFLIFLSEDKYSRPWNIIFPIVLGGLFIILTFFNTPLKEFNKPLTHIISYLILWKFISYGIRTLLPRTRPSWRQYTYYILIFVYVTCIVLNAISEYVFWNEFGVRYNFIAVDYLVYTNEVIGNIFESYPMVPLIVLLLAISFAISFFLLRRLPKERFRMLPSLKEKGIYSGFYIVMVLASVGLLNATERLQYHDNKYVNELQANGYFKFYNAFISNELDYKDFYPMIPWKEAFFTLHKQYYSGMKNKQIIRNIAPELHKNIILITIESMSADYLTMYGNKQKLTPYLDQLMKEGMCFTNLYAAGNRTVRGLEAVTLCVPPSPGESIIKRKNNEHLFSTGQLLRQRGYQIMFMYGGDSYFDNMKAFFSGNDYQIVDQKKFAPGEITFKNVWGVCDEDMYHKAIKEFNKDYRSGKPFLGHIMTVSNHRPYTYPDGRITIANKKSREGGVKYTDYAIHQFLQEAAKQPWFKNTVFVITADHCASSAGSTDIPIDKYHIPAVIYSPGFIKPMRVNTLMSQIDIMPTLFGLLHFSYISHFYGQNVFARNYQPRVVVATYQDLGYWQGQSLLVMSPVRRTVQFAIKQRTTTAVTGNEERPVNKDLLNHAIANYQTISYNLLRK
jgi:phosphoglycerol transferase MdoB-like AlkP superfamily enzyme